MIVSSCDRVCGLTEEDLVYIKLSLAKFVQIPYLFDIVDYKALRSSKLREHLDVVGITIYSKQI